MEHWELTHGDEEGPMLGSLSGYRHRLETIGDNFHHEGKKHRPEYDENRVRTKRHGIEAKVKEWDKP